MGCISDLFDRLFGIGTGNSNADTNDRSTSTYDRGSGSSQNNGPQLVVESIRLYSTGPKGKVYSTVFHKSLNHNFGVELVLKNRTGITQSGVISHCVYDENGNMKTKGSFAYKVEPYSTYSSDTYIKADFFANMSPGKYKSQFWIDNTKVDRTFFTIYAK